MRETHHKILRKTLEISNSSETLEKTAPTETRSCMNAVDACDQRSRHQKMEEPIIDGVANERII